MKKIKFLLPLAMVSLQSVTINNFPIENIPVAMAEETSARQHATQVIESLQEYFPQEKLPTRILAPYSSIFVSATTTPTSDTENFKVLYYAEETPYQVNDPVLNEKVPIAFFERISYSDEKQAQEAIHQVAQDQDKTVDLGYGIKAYQTGAMGSKYLSWEEGNWNLNIQAPNQEDYDNVKLAKEMVHILEEVTLPAPKLVGNIEVKMTNKSSHLDNSACWQEENIVYKITHQDPMTLLQMAGSIHKPTEQ